MHSHPEVTFCAHRNAEFISQYDVLMAVSVGVYRARIRLAPGSNKGRIIKKIAPRFHYDDISLSPHLFSSPSSRPVECVYARAYAFVMHSTVI